MHVQRSGVTVCAWLSVAAVACVGPADKGASAAADGTSSDGGELSVALGALGAAGHGVTGLQIDVVRAEDDCGGSVVTTQTLVVDAEGPADSEEGALASEPARQSFTLPAGDFRVCVTPLSGDAPSDRCAAGEELVSVRPGENTEVVLTLQCRDEEDGVIQTIVQLNEAPNIQAVAIDPGISVSVCDSVTLSLDATDADGDALTYEWTVGDPLRLRPYEGSLEANGIEATFSAVVAGNYIVNVAVDDQSGGRDELRIDIEVTAAACR